MLIMLVLSARNNLKPNDPDTNNHRHDEQNEYKKKLKILHFEDDLFLRKWYATKFSALGYDFVGYTSPTKDPVMIVLREKPDLIMMDTIMPIMDGFQATKILKQDKQTARIPILGLSNLGQKNNIQLAKESGMDDYWIATKHMPSEVVEKVDQFLKKY